MLIELWEWSLLWVKEYFWLNAAYNCNTVHNVPCRTIVKARKFQFPKMINFSKLQFPSSMELMWVSDLGEFLWHLSFSCYILKVDLSGLLISWPCTVLNQTICTQYSLPPLLPPPPTIILFKFAIFTDSSLCQSLLTNSLNITVHTLSGSLFMDLKIKGTFILPS